jgi:guanosine-3',5'-bis(diphosphate) 3'-pyrophosphohydrolase
MRDFLKFWEALTYAFSKYRNLERKSGGIPYVVHPIRVTMILRAAGYSEFDNEDLFVAALLHDLLEDTDLSFEELEQQFGNQIAEIVRDLTKPEGIDKDTWLKSFDIASKEAKIIKMADRIDNLMDLDFIDWDLERKKDYARQGLIIFEKCKEVDLKLALSLKDVIDQTLLNK